MHTKSQKAKTSFIKFKVIHFINNALICLLLTTAISVSAQTQEKFIDKIDKLLDLNEKYRNKPDTIEIIGKSILNIAKENNFERGYINGYHSIGFSLYRQGNNEKAI